MSEYCENSRKVAKKLLGAISESLGLEECAINDALALDSMLQIFIGNYYPRCPQPELAMGLPPHSDHGLITLLIQNEVGGLQLMHKQKWVDVNAVPNSLLVNTGDQLEVIHFLKMFERNPNKNQDVKYTRFICTAGNC